ncbi:MAG: DUF58 domain-containing protein [Thermoanaerobaculia bacterium]|nr:DUF58 domain-containing protein [Thermoanaerobaculia bacterium]
MHAAAPATAGGSARGVAARLKRWSERRGAPESIRITRVGLWFVLFTVIVGIAATNTGNNALYLVLAFMLALLVVSGVVSRWNLRRLEIGVAPPGELFAKRPTLVEFRLCHGGRLVPRWLLQVGLSASGPWRLVPHLAPGQSAGGAVEMIFPRRGRHALAAAHVASLFPLGLFRKGMRYGLGVELLVYPELFPAGEVEIVASGVAGDRTSARPGWGHELHALRAFRPGDDPRGIHWKKSAQTGDLVYQERESDETLRLSILLDNGCGRFASADEESRFERLVSEAATAAWDHLDRGFEVELVTRARRLPFGRGVRHRAELLTELALLEPAPRGRGALWPGDPGARLLRLGLGEGREAA